MRKAFWIIVIVILVLIGIAFLGPILFKGKILSTVKNEINKNVNAKVEFKDVSISLFRQFPDLQLGLEKCSVTGINTFEKDTLVKFKSFRVDVNLLSLLDETIKVNAVHLNAPHIFALVTKEGKANWDIAKSTGETAPDTATSASGSNIAISLKEFTINNGKIIYVDNKSDMTAGIKGLNYNLTGDFSQVQTSLTNTLSINKLSLIDGDIKYLDEVNFNYSGDIDANLDEYKFTFNENTISINELGLNFEGWFKMPEENIATNLQFQSTKSDFKQILSLIPAVYKKDFENIQTSGTFQLAGSVKGKYTGDSIPAFSTDLIVENASVTYPDVPETAKNINLNVTVKNSGGEVMKNSINVKKFHVEMADNPFNATTHVTTTADDVTMKGKADGVLDLTTLSKFADFGTMELKGIVNTNVTFDGKLSDIENENYEKFTANGQATIDQFLYNSPAMPKPFIINKSELKFSPQRLRLTTLDSEIGKSDIQLSGFLANYLPYTFKDQTLEGKLEVKAGLIDANELMVESETEKPEETQDSAEITAFEVPKNLSFTLNTDIDELRYDNMDITNLAGKLTVEDGIATINNISMQMLDGTLAMDGYYDSRNINEPKINFGLDINTFSIPKTYTTFNTVQKLAPIAKNLEGNFSSEMNLKSSLDNHLNPVYNSINGSGEIQSRQIKIKDSKTFNAVANATNSEQFSNPALKDIEASFTIEDGTIHFDAKDIRVKDKKITVTGKQHLDRTMDYQIITDVSGETLTKAASSVLDQLSDKTGLQKPNADNIKLAINLKGKFSNPDISLNMKKSGTSSAQKTAKQQIKDTLEKQKQELKDKAEAKADTLKEKAKEKVQEKKESLKEKAKEKAKEKLEGLW